MIPKLFNLITLLDAAIKRDRPGGRRKNSMRRTAQGLGAAPARQTEGTMKLCACGRPVNTGWTDGSGEGHAECLICRTARDLAGVDLRDHGPHAPRPYIICRCCRRVGIHAGHGLIRSCYHREYLRRGRDARS